MRTYRINCTDDADQIVATHTISCRDDLAALDGAQQLCAEHGVEVWEGARRIIWMHRGGAVRVHNPPIPSRPAVDWLDTDPFASQLRTAC